MKRYPWVPVRWRCVLPLLALVLIGNSVVCAQDDEIVAFAIENVTASSNAVSDVNEGPVNTVNGSGLDADGGHSSMAADMWLAADGNEPTYIQFEFNGVYELSEMWVWNYNVPSETALSLGVKDVTIESSEDGVAWTALDPVELAQAPGADGYVADTVILLDGVVARYVRLTVQSTWGDLGYAGLSEVGFLAIEKLADPESPFALTLDNFETYDPIDKRVYNVWCDGWFNATGATVGYFAEPFVEVGIVHWGLQAMPLFYDNMASPYYSETYRDLEDGLGNWYVDDADTLTLYFHGSTEKDHNVATDQLYVVVEDGRGQTSRAYHPDPEALLKDGWQEWTVGFDQLVDVDLSSVVRLALGIGDPNDPQPGGAGVVYIDDIGLTAGMSSTDEEN